MGCFDILTFLCSYLSYVFQEPLSFQGKTGLNLFSNIDRRYDLETKWKMLFAHIDSLELLNQTLLALFFPWYFLGKIYINKYRIGNTYGKIFVYLKFALPFYLGMLLLCIRVKYKNVDNIGWSFLLGFIAYSSVLRMEIREG